MYNYYRIKTGNPRARLFINIKTRPLSDRRGRDVRNKPRLCKRGEGAGRRFEQSASAASRISHRRAISSHPAEIYGRTQKSVRLSVHRGTLPSRV